MLKKTRESKVLIPQLLKKIRIGVVKSKFNGEFTQNLWFACRDFLVKAGVSPSAILHYEVPGALEIPIMVQTLAAKGTFDVLIALGVVIKGETRHFEIVADSCAWGIMDVSLKYNVPIIFEVIVADNLKQAKIRAGAGLYNKGREAASAALEIADAINSAR